MVGVGFSGLASLASEIQRAVQAGSRINAVLDLVKPPSHVESAAEKKKEKAPILRQKEDKTSLVESQGEGGASERQDDAAGEGSLFTNQEGKQRSPLQKDQDTLSEASSCPAPFTTFPFSDEGLEQKMACSLKLLKNLKGEIEFKNVSFSYTPGRTKKTASASPVSQAKQEEQGELSGPLLQASAQMTDLSPSLSDITTSTAATSVDMSLTAVGDASSPSTKEGLPLGGSTPEDSSRLGGLVAQKRDGMTLDKYEDDEESLLALRNISLTIPPGRITAITGQSGSGKTTLLKLLTKQIHPHQGVITLDGRSSGWTCTRSSHRYSYDCSVYAQETPRSWGRESRQWREVDRQHSYVCPLAVGNAPRSSAFESGNSPQYTHKARGEDTACSDTIYRRTVPV